MASIIQQLKDLITSNIIYPITKTKAVYDDDNNQLDTILEGKQSTISDLDTIRSGAAAGATAVQPVTGKGLSTNDYTDADKNKVANAITEHQSLSAYRTALAQDKIDSGKQATISDLETIRSGAEAGATAYQKPSTGIPKSDLASAVQTSIGKADSAYQKPSTGIPKSDLASAVQTSLGKADTALQSHQSLAAYRTSADQDTIDAGKASTSDVTAINDKIPSEASSTNQLADKSFVNSSISTATATFRGTSDSGLTEAQFLAWANALETKDNNDYVFWNTTDSSGNAQFKRYKYDGSSWSYEYTLNNSSFTAAQWSAISSGITSTIVSNTSSHLSNTTVHITSAERAAWNAKQKALTAGDNITITDAGVISASVDLNDANAVHYTEDSKTDAQKAQARANIGAGTSSFSGSYNDLTNTPTIPSKLSDLTADSTHRVVTDTEKSTWNAKQSALTAGDNITISNGTISAVDTKTDSDAVHYSAETKTDTEKAQARTNIGAGTSSFSGSYADLTNKPTIPSKLSDLTADSTHRIVTDAEKSTWNAKQSALTAGTNITITNNVISATDTTTDSSAVHYTAETKTDAEKAQARTNIGAGTLIGEDATTTTAASLIADGIAANTVTQDTSKTAVAYVGTDGKIYFKIQ